MPKSLPILPQNVRKRGQLALSAIPINAFHADSARIKKAYSPEALRNMYHDMSAIREFESALQSVKSHGMYDKIRYQHLGPAHLSIGTEAAAVGLAAHLTADDMIFGSHRSHGEILAKCFSALRHIAEDELLHIMETYHNGDILRHIERAQAANVYKLAEQFVLFGALAEIFAQKSGFNKGLGGSMHAFFVPFGSMPNNAIVGGSVGIALGAALYKRTNARHGIVVASVGDAALACGPVWEAITFSAMAQYRTLWPKSIGGAPPLLINVMNNFYGMGGQTYGETMGQDVLARIGSGVNAEQMHAERVDGYSPLAVADAVMRKRKILEDGLGPVLLDTITYRISGHSPSDISSYRTQEEITEWKQVDCIRSFGDWLITQNICTRTEITAIDTAVQKRMSAIFAAVVAHASSNRVAGAGIEAVMFSNRVIERRDSRSATLTTTLSSSRRIQQLQKKRRFGLRPDGSAYSPTESLTCREALFEAVAHRAALDPTLIIFGEENRDWGGAFAVYRGLTELLPYHRLFNAPISEAAIVAAGIGYALAGGRALVELMYCDFLGRAGDEIFNQMAKWQAMSGGIIPIPLVVRVSVGSKYGAQHSQDWSALVAHIPGLHLFYPATPYDAKGMLTLALRGSDPVIFFENQKLYNHTEQFVSDGVPRDSYTIKMGTPAIRRSGDTITILTVGPALYTALEAAERLADRWQIFAEVIDLRFIVPLDYQLIIESVRKTGYLLLVGEGVERGSVLHTVANDITKVAFDYLDAPPIVIGARNWITPAVEMEQLFFPQAQWIIDEIHTHCIPLAGYSPEQDCGNSEYMRRREHGV